MAKQRSTRKTASPGTGKSGPRSTRARKSTSAKSSKTKRWSKRVTETSDALDLDRGVFARADPDSIARSLKRSAEHSHRRKSDPFRSAMSMLVFYINRAGSTLSARRRAILERAKDALRRRFHRGSANER